jgi:hypothetical protein
VPATVLADMTNASPPGEPLGYVIVIRGPGVPLSLTDESVWTLEECIRDSSQVESDMPGCEAIVCEVRPVLSC